MLGPSIIGYVLGVVAGRSGVVVAAWLALAAYLPAFAAKRPRWRTALVLAGGFLWGAGHAGLTRPGTSMTGRIARVNVADGARGTVLVETAGPVYEAAGAAVPGRRVRLSQAPYPTVFSTGLRTTATGGDEDLELSALARFGKSLASSWKRSAATQTPAVAALLKSITVGDGTGLASSVHEDFKATGLYHLLVVSGQHVTMLGLFAATLLALPFRVAYALRLMPPRMWRPVDGALGIASLAVAVVYAYATGLNAATQRAVVMFAAWQLLRIFLGELPPLRRLALCLAAQILLFPIGLVSEAALVSWSAYLLVGAAGGRAPVRTLAWTQAKLCVIAAAAFGQLALFGIALNLVLVPVFTVAMLAAALLVAAPGLPGAGALGGFLLAFQQAVGVLAGVSREYGYFALSGDVPRTALRALLFLASAIFVLNTLRMLTIRRYVDD